MTPAPPALDLPDLTGRRALVTGGSDGIGRRVAERLAAAGAQVLLPVRNPVKGGEARDAILAEHPGARVELGALVLSSLAPVRALTDRLPGEGTPIDLLVLNAGVMTPPERRETADGFELQLGTNHLGHVALVAGLLPLLRAARARVVTQVSVAARSGSVLWDDLQSTRAYDAGRAYASSKIALGMFGMELQRRSEELGWGVTSVLSHPGVAATNLLAAHPEYGRGSVSPARRVIGALSARGILLGTPESAALPALLAATDPAPVPGRMYGPGGPGHLGGAPSTQPLYRPLRSSADASRIWDLSQELTGTPLP